MAKFVPINIYRKDVSGLGRKSILLNIDEIIYIGNDYKNDVEMVHLVDGKTIWLERSEIQKIIRASSK
ncbi:MAG: hypothetical protein J6P61_10215 [Erysipelotrichaceae bacterium]|nr:hypothetical protein [Erysipelotrichaceae bacterium]